MQDRTTRKLQRPQREALEELLRTEGYLTERLPLTDEELRQRLLTRLADRVTPEAIHAQIDWLGTSLSD